MLAFRTVCALCVLAGQPAVSAETDRNRAWDALLAAAKARGAQETRLDRSASFVFRRQDGSYVTLTRMFDGAKGRSVCLISKSEMATSCVDWDNGKLRLGKRNDARSPWAFFDFDSLEALEAAKPSVLEKIVSKVGAALVYFLAEMNLCMHENLQGDLVPNKHCSLDDPRSGDLGD